MSDNKAMDSKTASADNLIKTTANDSVELTEEELTKAAGGASLEHKLSSSYLTAHKVSQGF